MKPQTRLIVLVLAAVAIVLAAGTWFLLGDDRGSETGWRPAERAGFLNNSVDECRKAPGVTPERYPICDRACTCAADEGEKLLTAREADAAAQAMKSNSATDQQKAALQQMQQAGMRCAGDLQK